MNKLRRAAIMIGALGVALIVSALPASACSCVLDDPRDEFARADAAIIGEYLSKSPSEDTNQYESIYTFRVEEEYKEDFSDTLDVYSASDGAACGIEAEPGNRLGLFLYLDGDEWHSSLCSQTSPSRMRQAASELPEPTGQGAVKMIVGGSFGNARVMALDRRGRTLAYGFGGNRDVLQLDVCPRARRVVEVWRGYPGDPHVAIRNTATLRVIREVRIEVDRYDDVGSIHCRTASAGRIYVVISRYGERPRVHIYELRERRLVAVHRLLSARYATFAGRFAYLSGADQKLWRLNLKTGGKQTLYRSASALGPPLLNPDRTFVAAVEKGNYEPRRPTKLISLRLRDRKVFKREMYSQPSDPQAAWASSDRLVFLTGASGGSSLLSARLRVIERFGRWYVYSAPAIFDGKVWGASYGELLKAPLPSGPIKRDRRLPSPVNNALVHVPGRIHVEGR